MIKKQNWLRWLFALVYLTSYMGRNAYAAVLVEIIRDLQVSKSLASIAVTGAFFSYGLGQFVSGRLGDKFQPQKLVLIGLSVTGLINLSVFFLPQITYMNIIWPVGGFFHSMVWSPLVRMVTQLYPDGTQYRRVIGFVNQGSYVGQAGVFVLASLLVKHLDWTLVFAATGGLSVLMAASWFFATHRMRFTDGVVSAVAVSPSERLTLRKMIGFGFVQICLVCIVAGFLRDGIGTWIPSYFSEIYNMESSVAILTSVLLPFCAIITVSMVNMLADRLPNELQYSTIFMGFGALVAVVLSVTFSHWVGFDLVLMILISCAIRGAVLPMTSHLPRRFARYGMVSTISGIMDGVIYVGSGIATYVLALLSDNFGWQTNLILWAGIALIGALFCLSAIRPFSRVQ